MVEFKVVTDIDCCRRLWEKFSPKHTVWDLWDIAYAFNKGYRTDHTFIVGIEDGEEVGILPLQHEVLNDEEWTDFFGGNYPERRTFYIRDKSLIDDFLAQAPDDLLLTLIDPCEKDFIKGIKEDEISYSLDLRKCGYSLERYLDSFNKKHRKNMRYDLRQLEKLDYTIVWNVKEHLSRLAELNSIRFGDESNFVEQKDFYPSLVLLVDAAEKLGILHLLSIKIGGVVEASQIALFYNGTYHVLTGGSNPGINNLGKLMLVEHIKNAIRLKADVVDFMSYESGWKKLWNLDETMLYKFER